MVGFEDFAAQIGKTMQSMELNYVDVFAGCGGLSLGLHRAGWHGLFAIEKDGFAFSTLSRNFLDESARFRYSWPDWLEKKPWTAKDLIEAHGSELASLKGKVTLLAGGPPCQGFSTAGRRRADDPRNALVEDYLELVKILEPKILVIENVRGFTVDFAISVNNSEIKENSAAVLVRRLADEYSVDSSLLSAAEFGVPQNRQRFVLIAIKKGCGLPALMISQLKNSARAVIKKWNIPSVNTASGAISDFESRYATVIPSPDTSGFFALMPGRPRTKYQRAMRDGFQGEVSDSRLARHTEAVEARFEKIINICIEEGRSHRALSSAMRADLGIKKMATRVLDPDRPSPTITSMPDDLLHYNEPRTLTVRENARIQSFPDWFQFAGKYTTGGHRRRVEVPRFTQVANAVPPLMAEAIGHCLREHISEWSSKISQCSIASPAAEEMAS